MDNTINYIDNIRLNWQTQKLQRTSTQTKDNETRRGTEHKSKYNLRGGICLRDY